MLCFNSTIGVQGETGSRGQGVNPICTENWDPTNLRMYVVHVPGFHTGFFVGEGKKRSRKVTHANT